MKKYITRYTKSKKVLDSFDYLNEAIDACFEYGGAEADASGKDIDTFMDDFEIFDTELNAARHAEGSLKK